MSFKQFLKELNGVRVEGELIRTIFYSLLTSVVTLTVFYLVRLRLIADFLPKYGYSLFFAVLSYAFLIPAIRQVRAYKQFPCMSGMMIGMITGMLAGFLSGFYVGSTNGMFVGSIFGMFVGISLGVWLGKCCGIMGVMEGIMGGFMTGLMGGMTAIMLLNDNLRIAAAIIFAVSSVILFGLNYLIYTETKETPRQIEEDHFITIAVSFILSLVTAIVMVFGPRSSLFV